MAARWQFGRRAGRENLSTAGLLNNGSPPTNGTFNFTVTFTDRNGATGRQK